MRDTGTPTNIRLKSGTPVYLADKPCTACGCYQAFVFECNCGEVHGDVCFNCGGFVDIEHKQIPPEGDGWSKPCTVGRAEHDEHEHNINWYPVGYYDT